MTKKSSPKLKDLAAMSRKWPKLGKAEADKLMQDIEGMRHPVCPVCAEKDAVSRDNFELPSEVDFTGGVRGRFYKKPCRKGKNNMEILSEKITEVCDMEVEFKGREHQVLYEHAKKNMPKKILDGLMISWALGDILRKKLKELRDKMSPQARAAAEKKTQRMELALDITEKLFGEAPLHLKRPQTVELAKLKIRQLLVLAQVKALPIPKDIREKIVTSLGSDNIVVRMEKRWRIVRTVISAEREGLYEAAEHATGEVLTDLCEGVTPQNGHGEVDFKPCPVKLKKEGKVWIASCPSLDIHSRGATKNKARENLGEAIRLFIKTCSSRGTQENDQKRKDI